MTESEWLHCSNPGTMLVALKNPPRRKLVLFCCACCRRVWERIVSGHSRRGVVSAEQWADRPLRHLPRHVLAYFPAVFTIDLGPADEAASWTTRGPHWLTVPTWHGIACLVAGAAARAGGADEPCQQAGLLRCLFGNPFRPVRALSPAVLAFNGGMVVRLARAAYEQPLLPSGNLDPARLAILADALDEAGCSDEELLAHLRGPGTHPKGCWAVDAVLVRP
jgi:hypothetical protein